MLTLVNCMMVAMITFEAFSIAEWRVFKYVSYFAVFFNSLNICCKNFEVYRTLWLRYLSSLDIIVVDNASLGFEKKITKRPHPLLNSPNQKSDLLSVEILAVLALLL